MDLCATRSNLRATMKLIVNVAEIAEPGWTFIENDWGHPAVTWRHFSGSPKNRLERTITKPRLARYRACVEATAHLTAEDSVVISHLPRTTHWQSEFMHWSRKRNRHMAFAFNFTDLPVGRVRWAMTRSLQRIDRFVVFSHYECERYAEYFRVDRTRFTMVHWATQRPTTTAFSHPALDASFYCSVGGEGRDYRTLMDAFKQLPHLKLVVVCRPSSLAGINPPPNVIVFQNLPAEQFWYVVERSKALILPLRDGQTACGHITLAAAMALGKPVLATQSAGIRDYHLDGKGGVSFPSGSPRAIVEAVARCEEEETVRSGWGLFNQQFVQDRCSVSQWVQVVRAFVDQP